MISNKYKRERLFYKQHFVISAEKNVFASLGQYLLINICHFVTFYRFLDESLRWLLANGKTKQAMKIIKKAASWNNQSFESVMESIKKKQPLTSMELVIQTPEKPESNGDHQPLEGNGTAEVKQKVHKYSAFTILKHKKILIVSVLLWVIW